MWIAAISARLTGRVGPHSARVVFLLALILALGGAPTSRAASAVDTGGYPFTNATCGDVTKMYQGVEYCQGDNWTVGGSLWDSKYGGYGYRNCTDWVAYRLATNNGYAMPAMPAGRGDASYWGAFFAARGQAPVDTPTQGDIAWEPTGDHVAYVEKVSADGGSVTISEYNEGEYPPDPTFGGDGTYDLRVVPTSMFKYIHVKDIATTPARSPAASKKCHNVMLRLFNVDDSETAYVDRRKIGTVGYLSSRWFRLGNLNSTDPIRVTVWNAGQGYTWGIVLEVNGKVVHRDVAGRPGVGANNDDQTRTNRIVHDTTFRCA